jgi:hypothetical protein
MLPQDEVSHCAGHYVWTQSSSRSSPRSLGRRVHAGADPLAVTREQIAAFEELG